MRIYVRERVTMRRWTIGGDGGVSIHSILNRLTTINTIVALSALVICITRQHPRTILHFVRLNFWFDSRAKKHATDANIEPEYNKVERTFIGSKQF